ncbi:MAG: LemA family protein [Bacteroidetes bacterium]|jgi:LemA protein|nr:LemA family protein [Bacteroidota bacterium]
MNGSSLLYAIVLGGILLSVLFIYNRLISLKNMAHNALSNIDVQLKKRYDLIPSLVRAVKGYMDHEKDLLEKITSLRARAQSGNLSDEQSVDINNQLSQALGNLLVNVEAYPELKASDNFLHLQRSLAEVEEQLSASRRSFNMSVTKLNTALETFPSNLVGKLFSFRKQSLFEATANERQTVNVEL